MTPAERQAQIERYGQAAAELDAVLSELPRGMWQWRPAPDQWTVHEIAVHITDSEVNSYVRARRLIAEPGTTLAGYDEMAWAKQLNYHAQSVEAAVELFRVLRRSTYELMRALPGEVWAHTGVHSESGPLTLDDWLLTYARHVSDHAAQMRAVYRAWENAGRP